MPVGSDSLPAGLISGGRATSKRLALRQRSSEGLCSQPLYRLDLSVALSQATPKGSEALSGTRVREGTGRVGAEPASGGRAGRISSRLV